MSLPTRRTTTLFALLLAATTAAALGHPASSRAAAEKAIWGPVGTVPPGGGSAFDLYERLGVDTLQVQLRFNMVASRRPDDPQEPDDPAYRWPRMLDIAVQEAAFSGINIAVQVSGSPDWANGGRSSVWSPDRRAFADFLTAASRRYPTVRRWMIWGEPSRFDAYRPNRAKSTIGPRTYALLLDRSYGALKKVSRRNIVIGGMTFTGGGLRAINPRQWLRYMRLPNGRPPRLDWFGHNPFSTRFPKLSDPVRPGGYRDISDLDVFSREIARTYARRCGRGAGERCGRPKLWLSEYVIQSDHGSRTFNYYVSRKGQAQWLTAAYRIANRVPSVAGLGWLHLLDQPESDLSENFGLLTARGERKPSFYAFARAPSRGSR